MSKWISVEKQLPDREHDSDLAPFSIAVLVYDLSMDPIICEAFYNFDKKYWVRNDEDKYSKEVTYWMPLPDPPDLLKE